MEHCGSVDALIWLGVYGRSISLFETTIMKKMEDEEVNSVNAK